MSKFKFTLGQTVIHRADAGDLFVHRMTVIARGKMEYDGGMSNTLYLVSFKTDRMGGGYARTYMVEEELAELPEK